MNEEEVAIVILNDDSTPMEFVVEVLEKVFNLEHKIATRIMLDVHRKGGAILARLSQEKGDEAVNSVTSLAEKGGHPLLCRIASEEESKKYALKYL